MHDPREVNVDAARMRPQFSVELPVPVDEAVLRLREGLEAPELHGSSMAAGRCAELGIDYLRAELLHEGIASLRTALSLSPGHIVVQLSIGLGFLLKGEPEAALATMQQESSEPWRLIGSALAYHALGQAAESDAALAELIEKYEQETAYNIAYVLAYRGEADRAFEWLDKAVQYKDTGLANIAVEVLLPELLPAYTDLHGLRRTHTDNSVPLLPTPTDTYGLTGT